MMRTEFRNGKRRLLLWRKKTGALRKEDLKSTKYPTEEEAEEAGDTVSRAESRIESNNTEIQKLREEIRQLEQRSVNIMEQVEELKGGA